MAKTTTKTAFNSNIGGLTNDLLDEFDQEDLQDKKVSVHIHDRDKVKVKNHFVLLFVENLQSLLVNEKLTTSELKVLLTIVKYSSYQNVFKITQKTIANDLGIDQAIISRTLKKLRTKQLILQDSDGTEYVNPYLFLKGSIKEFKATDRFQQMSLHFSSSDIKCPY